MEGALDAADKIQFQFRQKIHRILAPPINLRVPFLAAKSFNLADRQSRDAGRRQSGLHFFQLERFDNGIDALHDGQVTGRDVNNRPLAVNRESEINLLSTRADTQSALDTQRQLAKHPRVGWFYRTVLRPGLFLQDSERAHDRVLRWLAWLSQHPRCAALATAGLRAPELPVEVGGLRFPNPIGLAAGMDKGAVAVPMWSRLGFGFAELGGVTQHAQPGNDAPRMFRAVADRALVNRMGFNNPGAAAVAARLAQWQQRRLWPAHPVGINLGKSKVTALENAAADYASSFRALLPHADFFVINVSSPNTPGLRQLQDKSALADIIAALRAVDATKPLWVKVAPDLEWAAVDELTALALDCGLAGVVATNTTLARPETRDPARAQVYAQSGGLSGAPLRARSTEIIRHIHRSTQGRLPIIGVGGVFNTEDAWEKITAGASLVQIYTGLVYEGPAIARDIVTGLQRKLTERGMKNLRDAVGTGA